MASARKSGGDTMEMTEQIEATVREVGSRVRPQIDEAKRRLSSLDETVTDYIKANPGTCLPRNEESEVISSFGISRASAARQSRRVAR